MLNIKGKTTISNAFQTAVPSGVRTSLDLKPGDKLTWYVEKNGDIKVKVYPKDFIKKYYGVGKSLYNGTDAQDYVNQLRDEWSNR
jgi:AbrB family looped-hinge helix DNA binding protein